MADSSPTSVAVTDVESVTAKRDAASHGLPAGMKKPTGKTKKARFRADGPVGGFKPARKLESHQVILRPLVTEKTAFAVERSNVYAFEIVPSATKTDVKAAVEELFEVRVAKVRTQNRQGKTRRHKARLGRTKQWKKAIVELHEDDRISLY